MTLLLRCAILLYIPFVCASLLRLDGTNIHTLQVDANDSPPSNNTRNLWDIIWSCGVTLFACAWTAIHPNIPGMEEKTRYIVFRRICIMVMVLIAPELIITWASRQFFSAIAITKRFNDALSAQPADAHDHHPDVEATVTLRNGSAEFRDWTITHGFFACMGGFILYVNDEPRATLTPDELLQFVLEESVDMPVIPEADIEDRSKGDILSKGVAILQLVWFVLQLAARRGQNLPISLLEIDTLAIVVLTFVAYCWWWKKPKDVGRPYIVHWKATALPLGNLTYDEADSRFSHVGCSRYLFYLIYPWLSSAGMGTIMSPSAARSRRVASLGGYGGPSDVTTALKIIGDHVRGLAMKAATRLFGGNWITSFTHMRAAMTENWIASPMRSRVMGAATWLIAEDQRIASLMRSHLMRAATWLDRRITSLISHLMRAATWLFGEDRIASLTRSYGFLTRSYGSLARSHPSHNLNFAFRVGMEVLNRIALFYVAIHSGAWVEILIRVYSATLLEGGREITAFIGGHSGMLLGGIHCLGWNFLFRRHAEQILWRVASFVIACAPLFVLIFLGSRIIDVYLEDLAFPITPPRSVIVWVRHFYTVFGSLLYIAARIIIFVLIILSLRSPPPGLYDTVDWTKYLLRFFT